MSIFKKTLILIAFTVPLLTACGGGSDASAPGTTDCTLGKSALDSCTLK